MEELTFFVSQLQLKWGLCCSAKILIILVIDGM